MSEATQSFPSLTRLREKAIERRESALQNPDESLRSSRSSRNSLVLDIKKNELLPVSKSQTGISPMTGSQRFVPSPTIDSPILSKLPVSPVNKFELNRTSVGPFSPPDLASPTSDQNETEHETDRDQDEDLASSLSLSAKSQTLNHMTTSRPKLTNRQQPTKNPVRELQKIQIAHVEKENDKEDDVPIKPSLASSQRGFKLPGLMPGFGLKKTVIEPKEEVKPKVDEIKPKPILKELKSAPVVKKEPDVASFAGVQLKSVSRAKPEVLESKKEEEVPFKAAQLKTTGKVADIGSSNASSMESQAAINGVNANADRGIQAKVAYTNNAVSEKADKLNKSAFGKLEGNNVQNKIVNDLFSKNIEEKKFTELTTPKNNNVSLDRSYATKQLVSVSSSFNSPQLRSVSTKTAINATSGSAVSEFQQMRDKLRSVNSVSKETLSTSKASSLEKTNTSPKVPEFVLARKTLKDVNQSTSNTNLEALLNKRSTDSLSTSRQSLSLSNLSNKDLTTSNSNIQKLEKQTSVEMNSDYLNIRNKLKPAGSKPLWSEESESSSLSQQANMTSARNVSPMPVKPTSTVVKKSPSNTDNKVAELLVKVKTAEPSAFLTKSDKEKADKYDALESGLKNATISNTSTPFSTQLKTTKNDQFINKAGGATRPKDTILWILKGKTRAMLSKVPIKFESLNQTDAFIMDIPPVENQASNSKDGFVDPEDKQPFRQLFVFTGEKTPKVRRSRAIEIANLIKDLDYSGKADIVLIDVENVKAKAILEKELPFWNSLAGNGLATRTILTEKIGNIKVSDTQNDADNDKKEIERLTLKEFPSEVDVVSNDIGLKQSLLDTSKCYVVDAKTEIYAWAGKASSDTARDKSLTFAQDVSKRRNIELFLEAEKFERVAFRLKFEDWSFGKELAVYNVLEVRQAGNIKAKDKEWKVYDRGSDIRKVDKVDIPKMYDKRTAPEISVIKNTEAMDIDPSELINRDWGFVALRAWVICNETGTSKVDLNADSLSKIERSISSKEPFIFYSKECYIFMYEYKERPPNMADAVLAERSKITKEELYNQMKDCVILYLWSGSDSTVSDQGIMAHTAIEIEKLVKPLKASPNAKPKHLKIQENKEPLHFLNVINGGNIPPDQPKKVYDLLPVNPNPPSLGHIVRRGTKDEFNNNVDCLYHISGITKETTHVAQLSSLDGSLICSAHCYILVKAGKQIVLWYGLGSFQWEQEYAKTFTEEFLAKNLRLPVQIYKEGSEPQDFWKALGSSSGRSSEDFWKSRPRLSVKFDVSFTLASSQAAAFKAPYDVRLWKVNYFLNGNPTASEISPFNCNDLDEDGTYILDAYFKLFVWIGANVGRNRMKVTNEPQFLKKVPEEKFAGKGPAQSFKEMVLAIETVTSYADYINERENKRISRSDVIVLQSGKETGIFKAQFPSWQDRETADDDWPSNVSLDKVVHLIEEVKYSVNELKQWAQSRSDLPFGLDLEKLEKYLTENDFEKTFNMPPQKFYELPQWKQVDMKKKVGLF